MVTNDVKNENTRLFRTVSTSLRWYNPDQVLRVSKAHFDLSLSKGPPSGFHDLFLFTFIGLSLS
ncbi:hypothetical protein B1no1_14930 [Thermolongibacillus altinsuensis]|nr:hypothetical protein B1no1_14930 [Thermolongibacillus altinsuensis]